MNLQSLLESKNLSSFTGYVETTESGESRLTIVFEDTVVDIDVKDNSVIVSQILKKDEE